MLWQYTGKKEDCGNHWNEMEGRTAVNLIISKGQKLILWQFPGFVRGSCLMLPSCLCQSQVLLRDLCDGIHDPIVSVLLSPDTK